MNGRYSRCCSVTDENEQEKRVSLNSSDVQPAKHKYPKVSRLSAPLPGSPKTPEPGAVSAKVSTKKVTGETKTPKSRADADEGGGKRAGRACDKAACVRVGLKPRCFAGATQR